MATFFFYVYIFLMTICNGEIYSYKGPYGPYDNIDGSFKICENTNIKVDISNLPSKFDTSSDTDVVIFGKGIITLGVGWCSYFDSPNKACNPVDCSQNACRYIFDIRGSTISVNVINIANGITYPVKLDGVTIPTNRPWIGTTQPIYQGDIARIENIVIETSGNCDAITTPEAILAYEFNDPNPLGESISGFKKYDLETGGSAATTDGKLILKNQAYVYTKDKLDFNLNSHSLEAYVRPSNLFSVGGGVAGISTWANKGMFESIVYNEHQNGLWFAGSEWFSRTKLPMTGPNVEPESCVNWEHMVITYDVENMLITMYKNGVQYGDAYRPSNPMLGSPTNPIKSTDNWKYLIGPRGLGDMGSERNQFLGEIDFSRLYNVVLTEQQVSSLYKKAQKSAPILNGPNIHGQQWGNNDIHIIISPQTMTMLIGLVIIVSVLVICCFYYGQNHNVMAKGYGKVKHFDTDSETN
eukprot:112051_1